jgi:hypothetical protein
MLEAVDLTKSHDGTVALDRLNLETEPGEVAAHALPGLAGTVVATANLAGRGWRALRRTPVIA